MPRRPPNPVPPAGLAPSSPSLDRIVAAAIFAFVVAALWDVFFVSFYADDFIFLDAARRQPVSEVLLGWHGIYPWYRPLSRELFFYLLLACRDFGPAVAHALAIACVFFSSRSLLQIGQHHRSAAAAAIAIVLFVTNSYTKLLAAWASGFQDTLSVTLILAALSAHLRGHVRRAMFFSLLAPFAKETGFAIFPLLYVANRLSGRPVGWLARRYGPIFLACVLGHVGARLTWRTGGSDTPIVSTWEGLLRALGGAMRGFVPSDAPSWMVTAVLASLAGGMAAAALCWWASRAPNGTSGHRVQLLVGSACFLFLAPLVLGNAFGLTRATAYYAYPAIPWVAFGTGLLAMRLAGRAALALAPIAGAFAIAGNAYREPDLRNVEAWVREEPSWTEAVRVSAVTRRLAEDVRSELKERPESLVVLYTGLPAGAFFQQSADGPATREYLRDPTVRAFYLNEAPASLDFQRTAILTVDYSTFHLERVPPTAESARDGLIGAIATGRPRVGEIWCAFAGESGERDPDVQYFGAALALLEDGRSAYAESLRAVERRPLEGAADSYGARWLQQPIESVLSPELHLRTADALVTAGRSREAAAELRIASHLGMDNSEVRLKLGILLVEMGATAIAEKELTAAVEKNSPSWAAETARKARAELLGTGR